MHRARKLAVETDVQDWEHAHAYRKWLWAGQCGKAAAFDLALAGFIMADSD